MKKYLIALFVFPILLCASEESDFSNLQALYEKKQWDVLVRSAPLMEKNYPESIFTKEVLFFAGVSYFHMDDPDLANDYLTKFLEKEGSSPHFEEALHYKYFIAEKFEKGYYGHLWGVSALPRLESMWQEAYQLYDEVISTIPRSEFAAKAMFRKASMYLQEDLFSESVEGFSQLIRKFSNNPLAQESFIQIMKVYKRQIKVEYLDPKWYEFALLNKKKFDEIYPSSSLKGQMEEAMLEIIDLYAEEIYKSALFFEKKKKYVSATMYLETLIAKYPSSKYATLAVQKVAAYNLDQFKELQNTPQSSILIGAE
jgi:outer membrane protein assembly factor BamD (BamD/ComL family)